MASSSSAVGARPAPPKKLTIKPLKKAPKLPEHFERDMWTKLNGAIGAVSSLQPAEESTHTEESRKKKSLSS
jgi:hypothetical protein